MALAITAAIVSNFVFHSFFTAWAGDYAWSIRYQVPVLPFLILPMVVLFKTQDSRHKAEVCSLEDFGYIAGIDKLRLEAGISGI